MKIKMSKADKNAVNSAEVKAKAAGQYIGKAAVTGIGVGVFLGCAEITTNLITGLAEKVCGKKVPTQKGGEQNA